MLAASANVLRDTVFRLVSTIQTSPLPVSGSGRTSPTMEPSGEGFGDEYRPTSPNRPSSLPVRSTHMGWVFCNDPWRKMSVPCAAVKAATLQRVPIVEFFGHGRGVATELERFRIEALRHQHGFAQVQQVSLRILHIRRALQYLARLLARQRGAIQHTHGTSRPDRFARNE